MRSSNPRAIPLGAHERRLGAYASWLTTKCHDDWFIGSVETATAMYPSVPVP